MPDLSKTSAPLQLRCLCVILVKTVGNKRYFKNKSPQKFLVRITLEMIGIRDIHSTADIFNGRSSGLLKAPALLIIRFLTFSPREILGRLITKG